MDIIFSSLKLDGYNALTGQYNNTIYQNFSNHRLVQQVLNTFKSVPNENFKTDTLFIKTIGNLNIFKIDTFIKGVIDTSFIDSSTMKLITYYNYIIPKNIGGFREKSYDRV